MHVKTAHFRQKTGHVSRVGAAIFLTGAFLLTSGIFTKVYSQNKGTKKGGDTVLLMQTGAFKSIEQAKKDTTKTMDTIPKLVIPDVRTLEHYMPYSNSLSDKTFSEKKPELGAFRAAWLDAENYTPPFGLSGRVLNSYSKEDRVELERRWENAKNELRVAFLSDKGATPSNAFKIHTPAEVKALLEEWQELKHLRNQKVTEPVPR
ncbi:MAG: hypothetical protein WCY41_00530 [Candidatus Micrarchaeia archaeon]|jgi:hypothetical protein